MKFLRNLLPLTLIVLSLHSMGQEKLDSLLGMLSSKVDTTQIKLRNDLAWKLKDSDPERALELLEQSVRMSEELGMEKEWIDAYNIKGVVFKSMGLFEQALENLFTVLTKVERMGDTTELTKIWGNIGNTYRHLAEYEKALGYYDKVLTYKDKMPPLQVAATLNNIGIVYQNQRRYQEALDNFHRVLEISKEFNFAPGLMFSYSNLGQTYTLANNPERAIPMLKRAMNISDSLGIRLDYLATLIELGKAYRQLGDYEESKKFIELALDETDSDQFYETRQNALNQAHRTYSAMGDYRSGYHYLFEFHRMHDSLLGKDMAKRSTELEMKHQFAQERYRDSIRQSEENRRKALEAKRKEDIQEERIKNTRNLAFIGFGFVLVLSIAAIFLFRSMRTNKKAKRIIGLQKKQVEEQMDIVQTKNKEITDSIKYAERIQTAILPSGESLKSNLPEHFVLYKPKDIVAGDFYWMESLAATNDYSSQQRRSASGVEGDAQSGVEGRSLSGVEGRSLSGVEGRSLSGVEGRSSAKASDAKGWSYIAAADCTGHGVPGAMVSVVCSNALTKALVEEKITGTGKLLDRTRELVIERFGKSGEEIKDGMDISIAAIRSDGKQVRWSGANNPLWIVKATDQRAEGRDLDGDSDSALIEIKADKQPIGKYSNATPFTQHTIDIQKGDTLYMFTDGYIDQFGGPKGKKLKSANFRKMLIPIQDKSMEEQKAYLDRAFEEWRGDLEQIDDVCVIGIRV